MSVIFQLAGKAKMDQPQELRSAFAQMQKGLRNEPGFERAVLLLSQATLQTQFLFYWSTFKEGLAFNNKFQRGLAARFAPLMENQGTLITSVLEAQVEGTPLPPRDAAGTEDGPVVIQFFGSTTADGIPKLLRAMDEVAPLMRAGEGFANVELLVNHQELKAQFLMSFAAYDQAIAWMKAHGEALLLPFKGLLKSSAMPFIFAIACDIRADAAETSSA